MPRHAPCCCAPLPPLTVGRCAEKTPASAAGSDRRSVAVDTLPTRSPSTLHVGTAPPPLLLLLALLPGLPPLPSGVCRHVEEWA